MHTSRRRAVLLLSAGALSACAARVEGEEAPGAALTPSEIEGPFFPSNTQIERDADLTRLAGRSERAAGALIEVRGRVLDANGRPLPGVVVELWQANAAGRYAHERDAANTAPLDSNFQGYAALRTGADGRFSALTIKPGGYLVPEMGQRRTPHLHWHVGQGGDRLTTQSYFPGEPANESDFLIRAMGDPVRRLIMAAGAAGAEGAAGFDWDILLPG